MAFCFPLRCVALLVFLWLRYFRALRQKGAWLLLYRLLYLFPFLVCAAATFALLCVAWLALGFWFGLPGRSTYSGGRHFVVEERIRDESGDGGDLRPPFFFLGGKGEFSELWDVEQLWICGRGWRWWGERRRRGGRNGIRACNPFVFVGRIFGSFGFWRSFIFVCGLRRRRKNGDCAGVAGRWR